jgi:hypothetical protein
LDRIRSYLKQARELGTVRWIYFEGGEPFLYYATLVKGVQMAAEMGFQVGVVSNAYWAISEDDAIASLKPFQGLLEDLSVSSDLYHSSEKQSVQVKNVLAAAEQLKIPTGVLSIELPEVDSPLSSGQIPSGDSGVMHRGRAADKLAPKVSGQPWQSFTACTHEDLRDPGRLHLDPLGNLHICQGISLGNLHESSLAEICAGYDPETHPVCGPLLAGGPAELVRAYGLPHLDRYADACHLCYSARIALRDRFPEILQPDQMYGVYKN